MKRVIFKTVVIAVLAVTAAFTSCNDDEKTREFTVSFDSNGGSAVSSQTVKEGEKATKPDDPLREGYEFVGWFNGDIEWNFDTAVTSNMTLIAKWIAGSKLKLVETMYIEHDRTYRFEYDSQNRITKITRAGSPDKYTLSYNGNDLVKINRESVCRITHVDEHGITTYEDVNTNEDFVYVKNGTKITGPDIQSGYRTWVISLNNDGLPTKIGHDDDSENDQYTLQYQNGNVTKLMGPYGKDDFNDAKYDNKKSPFYHSNTPKWFYWVLFGHFEFFCQNNPISYIDPFDGELYTIKYDYDSDGYVIRRFWQDDYASEYDVFKFTYK